VVVKRSTVSLSVNLSYYHHLSVSVTFRCLLVYNLVWYIKWVFVQSVMSDAKAERSSNPTNKITVLVTRDQCCCPRGKSCPRGSLRTNLQVVVLPRTSSSCLCLCTTKSSKIKDFAFCKLYVMYDHVKFINSVTPTMHVVMVKNVLLTDVRYYLQIHVSK